MEKIKDKEIIKKPRPEFDSANIEVVFGEYDYLKVPLNKIVMLPQTRGRVNPIQAELTRDIQTSGVSRLINLPDIALFYPDELEKHLEFINSIWGTKAKLSDYGQPTDGVYPVLISGHSRMTALLAIQEKTKQSTGVVCKIHDITSSAEFLGIQLRENIHSGVNPERVAMAAVEMYQYGYNPNAKPDDNNSWSSFRDFVRKNPGKLSADILSDGMAYASLPKEVRDFIFAGELYYGAGVEIGKNSKIIKDYLAVTLGEGSSDEDINAAYGYEIALIINHLINIRRDSKGGLGKSIDYIKGRISHMKSVAYDDTKNEVRQLEILMEDAPNRQRKEYLNNLKKTYDRAVEDIKSRPSRLAVRFLTLDQALTGEDHSSDIAAMERAYNSNIGTPAIKRALGLE